jgi:hypothetical protein
MKKLLQILAGFLGITLFSTQVNAQCPAGEFQVDVVVNSDNWGYELYWELNPVGDGCGVNTLVADGDSDLGCDGLGTTGGVPPTNGIVGNLASVTVSICLPEGDYDLNTYDSYGDGLINDGNIQVFVDGILVNTFTPNDFNNTFTFSVVPINYNMVVSDLYPGWEQQMYQWPLRQLGSITPDATVTNNGLLDQTGVTLFSAILDQATGWNIYDNQFHIEDLGDMLAGESFTEVYSGEFAITTTGVFAVYTEVDYDDSADEQIADDNSAFVIFEATDNTFARIDPMDRGFVPTSNGFGNIFEMLHDDVAASVGVYIANLTSLSFTSVVGSQLIAELYLFNGAGWDLLGSSDPYITVAGDYWSNTTDPLVPLVLTLTEPVSMNEGGFYMAAVRDIVNATNTRFIAGEFAGDIPCTQFNGTTWEFNTVYLPLIELNTDPSMCSFPEVAVEYSDVSCFGAGDGEAMVVATGGDVSVTNYEWSTFEDTDMIAGLVENSYDVTVTYTIYGETCSTVIDFDIMEPTALDVDYTTTPEFCDLSDGEISLTITDGTSPYTISWANGSSSDMLTGLVGGNYDVTVMDANDCSVELSINVVAFVSPSVDILSSDATCGGSEGDVLVTPITGTAPYSFIWENGETTDLVSGLAAGVYDFTLTDANSCVLESYATVSTDVAPNITVTSTDALCFGDANGTIGAMADGTTATYTFDWFTLNVVEAGVTMSGASGIPAGSYPVEVRDENDCVVFGTAIVDEPTQLVASISGTVDATCNGDADGEAMVTATGGTGAYHYEWANGQTTDHATSLGAGTVDVTVTDDNGCTSEATATIAQPDVLVASVSSNNISCNGLTDGDATASAVGGNGGYDYTWSNSATTDMISGLAAGTFTVTVEDMLGCTASASGNVTEPTVLSVNVTNNGPVCALATTSITATPAGGTAGYTYNWNVAGATASITGGLGTYNVTVTDSKGCTATGSTTVTLSAIGANVTLTAVVDNNATDNNGQATATATGGTGVYVYTWSNTQVGPTATGLAPNDYTVTAADATGCISNTVTVTIGVSSLNELTQTSSYSVYPNPNNGIFNVKLNNVEQGVYTVEVRNLLGQVISSNQVTTAGNTIVEVTLNDVNAGVYFLNVRGNNLDKTERIIIK